MNINQFMEFSGFAPGSISIDKRSVEIKAGGPGSGRHQEDGSLKRDFKRTMSQAQQLKHATLKGRGWKDLGDDKRGNLLLERPDSLGGGKYSVDKDAILKRIEAGGPGSGRHPEGDRWKDEGHGVYSRPLPEKNGHEFGYNGHVIGRNYAKTQGRAVGGKLMNTYSKDYYFRHNPDEIHKATGKPISDIDHFKRFAGFKRKEDAVNHLKSALQKHIGSEVQAGGPGSGRHKTSRKQKDAGRQSRGLASYNPSTQAKQQQAINNEKSLAKAIPGAIHISDNKPFDVLHPGKRIGFEVKTKIDGKKNTITMHPSSLGRKIKEKRTMKLKAIYTVIFDNRPSENKIYIAKGVGSFKIKLRDGTINPKLREINLGGIKKIL